MESKKTWGPQTARELFCILQSLARLGVSPHRVKILFLKTDIHALKSHTLQMYVPVVHACQSLKYEGESIVTRNAVAFVFLLAALSFSRASLGVVFFLSQLCRFEVARSVPLSQP